MTVSIKRSPGWCEKCGKVHRDYSDMSCVNCAECCKEVAPSLVQYPGKLCSECCERRQAEADRKKRENARPGLVECDSRYAYWNGVEDQCVKDLQVGDIVWVPPSYVDELQGRPYPRQAVVTCLYSDYSGEVKPILGLVSPRKRKRRRPWRPRSSRTNK
jgi:hypothetical protein